MAEVDSLKAVLEMKTEEIHALRLEKAKLEDKLEEFDRMKLDFGKVTAQLEDLKAQLNDKQALERKLSEENRHLYDSMERELNAKRRITMEKEELEWRMRSFSGNGPMSMSMMEGKIHREEKFRGKIRNFLYYNMLCHRVTFIFQLFFCAIREIFLIK